MIRTFAGIAMLAILIQAPRAAAQTAAEQLEKAIYKQETEGDLDAAIQMYRQIISSNPSQRALLAQAHFRVFHALIQKGDLVSATQEFQTLALEYSDQRELIASLSRRLSDSPGGGPRAVLGTIENNRYRHKRTGIEFDIPSGWAFQGDSSSSDDGEMIILTSSKTNGFAAVWLKPDPTQTQNIPGALRFDMNRKHLDRQEYPDWTIRPSSVHTSLIDGQQVLSAMADFTENGHAMVESMNFVRTTKGRAFFFGRVRAEESPTLQAALDQMMATATVP